MAGSPAEKLTEALKCECGGFFEHVGTRGISTRWFRCNMCNTDIWVDLGPEYVAQYEAKQAAQMADIEARMAKYEAKHHPKYEGKELTWGEAILIAAYKQWSEDHYCAGFMDPSPGVVKEFKESMGKYRTEADYEEEFLIEWNRT